MSVSATGPSAVVFSKTAWRRRWSYAQDASLICVSALFFYVHATHAVQAGSITNVFFAIEQGLLIGIFLTRRRTTTTSTRPRDWMVATVGGWGALLMQPGTAGAVAATVGTSIQVVGLSLVVLGFATIGKSFGVVAANRGLKVGGPYRFVRHPIYLAHTLTLSGFVLANQLPVNVAIILVVSVCQVARIHAEERILTETSDYASYKSRVRWRLLPGVF